VPETAPPFVLFGATSVLGFTLASQLGNAAVAVANPHNRAADAQAWHRGNVETPEAWISLLQHNPNAVVLYAHAVCDVGKCEQYPDWAWQMNVGCLQTVLERLTPATRFVYLSSDHVFGGNGTYCENSTPTPISKYGATRVSAERLVLERESSLVIRCGLPIGPSLNGRTGFHDWLRYRYERNLPITVIRDESRSAAWASDLAERIAALAQSPLTGIRHIAAAQVVSRPRLATFLMQRHGLPADFELRSRSEQSYPHLGHVELTSCYDDALGQPMPAVITDN
jgi:dTDP-4-dehydrorhamnose reductase